MTISGSQRGSQQIKLLALGEAKDRRAGRAGEGASRRTAATGTPRRLMLVLVLLMDAALPSGRQSRGRASLAEAVAVDHCYSDLGCFPLSAEFYHPRHRPINVRPWHRSRIRTRFELYTRHKHPQGFMLQPWNPLSLHTSGFNPLLDTKVIVPGWLDNVERALWVRRMRDAFLWQWHPVNVIVVHWRNFTPYTIATANTRVVGAELALLLRALERHFRYHRTYFHLIGHSLGAHIGGYTGDRLPGLGRITALDPARPFFQHMPKSVRLDRADAKFVDAIHSDFTPENAILLIMSFGMTTPVGHLDFYPNGPPLLQAGCLRDTLASVQNGIRRGLEHGSLSMAFLETLRYMTACDHQRSHEWFTESITNRQCVFVGVRCHQFEGLINGRCTCDDSPSACAIMGVHADQLYLSNLHEELWPARTRDRLRGSLGATRAPPIGHHSPPDWNELGEDDRMQAYAKLKDQTSKLANKGAQTNPLMDDLLPMRELANIQDAIFVDYLREQLFARESKVPLQRPLTRRQLSHPTRLSDVTGDIERWYEDNSRWHLKTNNRPNFCVNQYQLLIQLGELESSSGRDSLRANLVVSIVGSHGQLLNQRFVPRSAKLSSFTMQPFFILLEGAYSLGTIQSVAVSWEARKDPDPVQATVSFRSNLLEGVQALLPPALTQTLKEPLLGDSLVLNRDDQPTWAPQAPDEPHRSAEQLGEHRERRSVPLFPHQLHLPGTNLAQDLDQLVALDCGSNEALAAIGQCALLAASSPDVRQAQLLDLMAAEESQISMELLDHNLHNLRQERLLQQQQQQPQQQPLNNPDELELSESIASASLLEPANSPQSGQLDKPAPQEADQLAGLVDELLALPSRLALEEQASVKLHNIDLQLDDPPEDSIVIRKVVVSPLLAKYAKFGAKVGKTFCPPVRNQRLRRDQTVRLQPNLLGDCAQPHRAARLRHRHHQQDPRWVEGFPMAAH